MATSAVTERVGRARSAGGAASAAAEPAPFRGFTREAITFLADLAEHNDRAWFQPRKADYERLLKAPLEALCAALDVRFRELGIPLSADPATSPFRIHRDVRFSKDKSPYKTNLAASFPATADRDRPGDRHSYGGVGGYFSFGPGRMYVGGGRWQPTPATMAAWRALVVERNADLRAALDAPAFVSTFGRLTGEAYKRVPSDAPADHADAELLKLRQILFSRQLSDRDVLSPRLTDTIATSFVAALPLMRLLATLPGEDREPA